MENEQEDEKVKTVRSLVGEYFKESVIKTLKGCCCYYPKKGYLSQNYQSATQ